MLDEIIESKEKLSVQLLKLRGIIAKEEYPEIYSFIENELDGYTLQKTNVLGSVPNYRIMKGELVAYFVDNYGRSYGPHKIGSSELNERLGWDIDNIPIIDGIGFVELNIENLKDPKISRLLPKNLNSTFQHGVSQIHPELTITQLAHEISLSQYKQIISGAREALVKKLQDSGWKMPKEITKIKENFRRPERAKISVFVTYSWESEEHNDLVISFCEKLRNDGYEAQMDISKIGAPQSFNLMEFMVRGMMDSDKIIVVLSEGYKKKADNTEGGVWTEFKMILEILKSNPSKIIFVSFKSLENGYSDSIIPLAISGQFVLDLKQDQSTGFNLLNSKLESLNIAPFSQPSDGYPEVKRRVIKPFEL